MTCTSAPRKETAPSNFLVQLNRHEQAGLLAVSQERMFAKGETVFDVGDPGTRIYVLRRGRVKIHEISSCGRAVILWFCLPGELFGLAEVAQGSGREVRAEACEDSAVLVTTRESFQAFLATHPRVAWLGIQAMASRLRGLGHMLLDLVADDVPTRLGKLLLRLLPRYGERVDNGIRLCLHLTHQEIADMLGTTRQTVSSELAAMRRRGLLRIDRHRIVVVRKDLLAGAAAQRP